MPPELKIGVTSWKSTQGWDAPTLCRQAETAESLGFHSYWLPENHFRGPDCMPAPLMLLAAAAASTSTIRLGTASYLLPIRHPLLAAEEVAVLDQLCGGRVILGVGRGVHKSLFQAFDLPSAEKRTRFAENLEVMRRAWSGEALNDDSSQAPVFLSPLPVQRPSPPIWVAAFGPLALRQVGELGLPYLASPMESLEALEKNFALYRSHAQKTTLDLEAAVPVMRTVYVSDDEQTLRALKQRLATDAGSQGSEAIDDWAILGDHHFVKDKLAEYSQRLGMTHLIVSNRLPGLSSDDVEAGLGRLLECVG